MTVSVAEAATAGGPDADRVAELYSSLIVGWNNRDAAAFASVFAKDGGVIGYDGSDLQGRAAIQSELQAIFEDHTPAAYVAKVRTIEFPAASVAVLRAIVGMVPPGESELAPDRNAHQTLLARRDDDWQVVLFQNTPAVYDGRPQLVEAMTQELRALV